MNIAAFFGDSKGRIIVRGKPLSIHNPRTAGLVHASNRFVQDNMEAIQIDEDFKATVNFEKLTLSSGKLKPVKISVRCAEDGTTLTFTQTAQAQKLAVIVLFCDKVVFHPKPDESFQRNGPGF